MCRIKSNLKKPFLVNYLIVLFFLGISSCDVAPYHIEPFSQNLKDHIEILSSKEFEGRAPATKGGRKTVEYIESEFKKIGLNPAVNGSYKQPVPLIEITGKNFSDLEISYKNVASQAFQYDDDMIVWSNCLEEYISIEESELVFVGYGIVAPEYNWNDYEGVDVDGKTVIILVNDPGFATKDDNLFTGNAMTYYGRWTYKFEEAARQGAEAAIIIHDNEPAGYGWDVVRNSWMGAQYILDNNSDEYQLKAEGWLQLEAAKLLFRDSGLSFKSAMKRAQKPGFTAEPLNQKASLSFNNNYERIECYNVVGYIEGSKYPDETIIYMGHWDHLGKEEIRDEVHIYHGAVDNATGTAGVIAMAEHFSNLEKSPKRSIVFMAVTAEESGLLGSQYYAENPLFPIEKTVGGINMDALNVYGPTHDVSVVGYGLSELDKYLKRHAGKQNRTLKPDPSPNHGHFYRSDHYSLVRKGIPMIYANGGYDFIGKDQEYSQMVAQDISQRYHQPTDVIHDLWNYDGIHQDLWLFFNIGKELANEDSFPKWYDDSPYKEIRKKSAEKRQR